jgi:hypothetical protein
LCLHHALVKRKYLYLLKTRKAWKSRAIDLVRP